MTMARLVDAPALRTNPHGLVESGNRVEDDSGRWQAGVVFTPDGCHVVNAVAYACPSTAPSAAQDCIAPATFMPYTLDLTFKWSTADRGYDVKARAIQHLEAGTSSRLEALISAATAPTLEGGTALTSSTDPRVALGKVEAALLGHTDHTGGGGTICMSPVHANVIGGYGLCEDNGHLQTVTLGNKVIVGNFPTTDIYGVIGDIDVYLGDITVNEAPDSARVTNEQVIQVERPAMAVWNPCAVYQAPVA